MHNCVRRQLHARHTWRPVHCVICSCRVPWHTCSLHRAEGFACGTLRKPPKPKDALPPPKRRTTPLGGVQGAQWTDSIKRVPIGVPALPDFPAQQAAGSFENLVAHATRTEEEVLLPPLMSHFFPACLCGYWEQSSNWPSESHFLDVFRA